MYKKPDDIENSGIDNDQDDQQNGPAESVGNEHERLRSGDLPFRQPYDVENGDGDDGQTQQTEPSSPANDGRTDQQSGRAGGTTNDVRVAFTPTGGESERRGDWNTRAQAYANAGKDEMGLVVNAAGIGRGAATARLFGTYTPPATGKYRITAVYYRVGNIANPEQTGSAEASFRVFVRDDGIQRKEVENPPEGLVDGTEQRSDTFHLEGGREYDIGLEVRGRADEFGAGSLVDFYNDIDGPVVGTKDRRVELNQMIVTLID
jgi:hypothetical protein